MFEEKIRLGNLYDFYGSLLTKKQYEILGLYCVDDLSLGEISENLNISRQAVYDTIKRSKKTLKGYEEKLGLLSKFSSTRDKVNDLIDNIDSLNIAINSDEKKDNLLDEIERIKKALGDILDGTL